MRKYRYLKPRERLKAGDEVSSAYNHAGLGYLPICYGSFAIGKSLAELNDSRKVKFRARRLVAQPSRTESNLKTVRGTQAHNFDVNLVQSLLESDKLTESDAKRILSNAITVIAGLRDIAKKAITEGAYLNDFRHSSFVKPRK